MKLSIAFAFRAPLVYCRSVTTEAEYSVIEGIRHKYDILVRMYIHTAWIKTSDRTLTVITPLAEKARRQVYLKKKLLQSRRKRSNLLTVN